MLTSTAMALWGKSVDVTKFSAINFGDGKSQSLGTRTHTRAPLHVVVPKSPATSLERGDEYLDTNSSSAETRVMCLIDSQRDGERPRAASG